MFKAKTLIENVGTTYLKQVTLPRPLLFHTTLKIPQPNKFMLSYTYSCVHECECISVCVCVCVCVCVICLCVWVCLWWWAMLIKREYVRLRYESVCVYVCEFVSVCVCLCEWVSEWVCVCVCVFVCLCKWVSGFVMMSHVDKAWICSAEKIF